MINSLLLDDVAAVEDDFAAEFVGLLLDFIVLDHDDNEVNIIEERVEVMELVGDDVLLDEGIVALEGTGKMALLGLQQLECGAFAAVVNVLLIGEAVETDTAVVGYTILLHDFIDAVENEGGLAVVGLHRLVDYFCQTWIVAHKEPGIDTDAVTAYTGTGL